MSLLDTLPDRCTIRRRVRTKGSLGGKKDSYTNESTNVECWEQQTGASQSTDYEKKGNAITTKVYFTSDPGLTPRHQILITSRRGTAIAAASQVPLYVKSQPHPDVSVGFGLLWRVECSYNLGEDV